MGVDSTPAPSPSPSRAGRNLPAAIAVGVGLGALILGKLEHVQPVKNKIALLKKNKPVYNSYQIISQ